VLPQPEPDLAARALRALAADAGLRQRLARAGRAAAERFTWDATVQRTLELYDRVTG
jgi:glycosyltransferase involved in cell wall biosynthesis